MNNLSKHVRIVVCLLLLVSNYAIAQTKVVVIPLGADARPLKNIITVAKSGGDYTSPLAAMNAITNASATNPYLVVIGPGEYDIGTASLDLKPYVSIQGAGAKQTTLLSSALSAVDQYAVKLVANSSLSGLRVRQDANVGTNVYGVIGSGLGYAIHDCEIEASNSASRAVGFSIIDENAPSSGLISNTEFIVPGSIDQGIGRLESINDEATLRIVNSAFTVVGSGTAISSIGMSSNGNLLVQSTSIILLGDGGRGISNTDGDGQTYQSVSIYSEAANARGLSGSGSGFRPFFENSKVQLTGTGSIAVSTNNGRPRIRNSSLQASIGFTSTSNTAVFSPTFFVDNSVVSASTAVLLDNGFALAINFNASRLDAFTKLDAGTGTINAKCVSSADRNYNPLRGDCS